MILSSIFVLLLVVNREEGCIVLMKSRGDRLSSYRRCRSSPTFSTWSRVYRDRHGRSSASLLGCFHMSLFRSYPQQSGQTRLPRGVIIVIDPKRTTIYAWHTSHPSVIMEKDPLSTQHPHTQSNSHASIYPVLLPTNADLHA